MIKTNVILNEFNILPEKVSSGFETSWHCFDSPDSLTHIFFESETGSPSQDSRFNPIKPKEHKVSSTHSFDSLFLTHPLPKVVTASP